jgi:hypothetical protein
MLDFEISPDDHAAALAGGFTDEQLTAAYRLQEKAYTRLREVLVQMGVDIRREDPWPTVENKARKQKITWFHDFDENTAGKREDRSGWFIKKDDILQCILHHPYPDKNGDLRCDVSYPSPTIHTAQGN